MPAKVSVFKKVGKKFTTHRISKRVQEMSVSAIKEMSLIAMDMPDSINLAWGLPSFPTPLHVRQRISEEVLANSNIGKYAPPPGLPALKRKLAEHLQTRKSVTVNPDTEMIITAGGMQGLMMTWLTILEPGDEVLVTSPGFSSHYEQIGLASGIPVGVPLVEEQGWRIDPHAFRASMTERTKALVIVNPSNPTGTLFDESALRELGELALENDLFMVTDDPYEPFVYDGQRAFSLLSVSEIRRSVISCYSFSKEFAMTGWRVGWLLAEEGIINQILKVQDSFVICAPHISQLAALYALEGTYETTFAMAEELVVRREIICERLDRLPELFSYQRPQGAYYVFPRLVPRRFADSVDFCVKLLREAKVVTVPGSAFGATGERHIRISYCSTRQEINEAFDRIERWWAEMRT